jgi:hypothetical protein
MTRHKIWDVAHPADPIYSGGTAERHPLENDYFVTGRVRSTVAISDFLQVIQGREEPLVGAGFSQH